MIWLQLASKHNMIQEHKGLILVIIQRLGVLLMISTSRLANHSRDSMPLMGVYYRVPQSRRTTKIFALTRQPRTVFSQKPQPSVLFSTINILFRISMSFKWSRNPNEIYVNLQIAMTVLLQLCKVLTDQASYPVKSSTK